MNKESSTVHNRESEPKSIGWLLTSYKLTVELLKSLFWPVITLFIFLSIKAPLLLVLQQLPEVLSKSTHLTVGSVSVDLQRRLKVDAPKDLQTALSGLPPAALVVLLGVKGDYHYLSEGWEKDDLNRSSLLELQKRNLIVVAPTPSGAAYPFQYSPTELGNRACEFVYQLLIEQLLTKPSDQPTSH